MIKSRYFLSAYTSLYLLLMLLNSSAQAGFGQPPLRDIFSYGIEIAALWTLYNTALIQPQKNILLSANKAHLLKEQLQKNRILKGALPRLNN